MPFLVPATTLLLSFGSTRTLPTASYCGNWPGGCVVRRPEDVRAEHRPGGAGVGRLEDALAAHREGAEVEVARARVDRVVVAGVECERVDRDRGDQRVVGHDASSVVGVLQQFVVFQTPPPTLAAVGDDRAVRRRRRVDHDRVDAALGLVVVVTTGAAVHPLRLRAESCPGRAARAGGSRARGWRCARSAARRCAARPG